MGCLISLFRHGTFWPHVATDLKQKSKEGGSGKYAAKQSITSTEEGEAATKIQAGFRGYKARKEVKLLHQKSMEKTPTKLKSPPLDTIKEEEEAATKIQAGIRGFLTRKKMKQSCDLGQSQSIDVVEGTEADAAQAIVQDVIDAAEKVDLETRIPESTEVGEVVLAEVHESNVPAAVTIEAVPIEDGSGSSQPELTENTEQDSITISEDTDDTVVILPEFVEVMQQHVAEDQQSMPSKMQISESDHAVHESKVEDVPKPNEVEFNAASAGQTSISESLIEQLEKQLEVEPEINETPAASDTVVISPEEAAHEKSPFILESSDPEQIVTQVHSLPAATFKPENGKETPLVSENSETKSVPVPEDAEPAELENKTPESEIQKEVVKLEVSEVATPSLEIDSAETGNANSTNEDQLPDSEIEPEKKNVEQSNATPALEIKTAEIEAPILQAEKGIFETQSKPESPEILENAATASETESPLKDAAAQAPASVLGSSSIEPEQQISTPETVNKAGTIASEPEHPDSILETETNIGQGDVMASAPEVQLQDEFIPMELGNSEIEADTEPIVLLSEDYEDEVNPISSLASVQEEDAGSVATSPEPITAVEMNKSQTKSVDFSRDDEVVAVSTTAAKNALPEPKEVPIEPEVKVSSEDAPAIEPSIKPPEVKLTTESAVTPDIKPVSVPTEDVPVQRRSSKRNTRPGSEKYRSGVVVDTSLYLPEPSTTHDMHKLDELDAEIESDAALLNNAASKIQAGFRGYQVRKSLNTAATKIQSNFRGYRIRKNLKTQSNAAVKIQATVRGYLTRKRVYRTRAQQLEQRKRDVAARRRSSSAIQAASQFTSTKRFSQ